MPGDAAARGAAFGQQTETMLFDALNSTFDIMSPWKHSNVVLL